MKIVNRNLVYALMLTAGSSCFAMPETALAELASDRFEPTLEASLLDVAVNTGDVPGDAALSVSLVGDASDNLQISMAGDAWYDWDAERIWLEGELGSGSLEYTIGADVDISGGLSSELPPIDESFLIAADAMVELLVGDGFDPYLLTGDAASQLELSLTQENMAVASGDVDAGIVQGQFNVLAFVSVNHLRVRGLGVDIYADLDAEPLTTITETGASVALSLTPPAPGETVDLYGIERAEVDLDASIVYRIQLELSALGADFALGPYDVELASIELDAHLLEFDPDLIQLDGPGLGETSDSGDSAGSDTDGGDTDSGGTDSGGTDSGGTDSGGTDSGGTDSAGSETDGPSSGSDSGTGGDPSGGSAGSDSGGDSAATAADGSATAGDSGGSMTGGETDTDGVGLYGYDDEGCGCRAGGARGTAWSLLAFIPLLVTRRRRARR